MRYLSFFLCLIPASLWAQEGFLGTKGSPIQTLAPATGGSPFMSMIQVLVALGLVWIGIKFGLPKILEKAGGRLSTKLGSNINIEESASFPGGNLFIVQAKSKTILLCVTSNTATCLADLTDSEPPRPTETFQDIISKASAFEPKTTVPFAPYPGDHAVVEVDADPDLIQKALKRIKELNA